ncbi:MAG: hypothetical protein MJZ21_03255 [archaeon]|nr:hypothetical protein [archaeon]
MDKKIVAVVAAVIVVAAAGIGAFALLGNNGGDKDNNYTFTKAGEELIGGTFDSIIIDASVGDGEVLLKNVKILKDLIVRGGGSHSIKLTGCELKGTVSVEKVSGEAPRILAEGTHIASIIANSDVILEASKDSSFADVVSEGKTVTVQGNETKVGKISITDGILAMKDSSVITSLIAKSTEGNNVKISLGENSTIDSASIDGSLSVDGKGDISKVEVNNGSLKVGGDAKVREVEVNGNVALDLAEDSTEQVSISNPILPLNV